MLGAWGFLSMLHLALGILRCPSRWSSLFVQLLPRYWHQSQCTIRCCGRLELLVLRQPDRQQLLFPVFSGASVGRLKVSSFLNHDWFTCQLQRVEFLQKGSHEEPLFRMFPLSLQSIISNQVRPRRLKGAWFSRLLRHLASKQSGSILSPGTHTGLNQALVYIASS